MGGACGFTDNPALMLPRRPIRGDGLALTGADGEAAAAATAAEASSTPPRREPLNESRPTPPPPPPPPVAAASVSAPGPMEVLTGLGTSSPSAIDIIGWPCGGTCISLSAPGGIICISKPTDFAVSLESAIVSNDPFPLPLENSARKGVYCGMMMKLWRLGTHMCCRT